ncbi:hypothetical protein MMC26_002156 [Xylographa opegraphella]|nr:hypothetical protein [Xylographa opegraphella]
MRLTSVASLSALAACVVAAPYGPFPLQDGFPSPSPAQLKGIETLAGGSLPNGPLPTKLQPSAVAALQLIALNEIFEVAYFTDLLTNITTNVAGYDLAGYNRTFVIEALTAVANQEKLHALGANGILASANATQITPCEYMFPVSDFLSAITLAQTFTDVVLGVLPQGQTLFASDGGDEVPLVNLIGSIIAQEGQQDGWYRSLQLKTPSAAPFLTTEAPAFAFTFLQGVIVPGSCPGVDIIGASIPTFGPLTVVSMPPDMNSTATFAVPGTVAPSTNSLVYLSGQNLPLTVPISTVTSIGGLSYFNASLPFDSGFAKGLTIAALVSGTGVSFANASMVASATLYGPGIIEID